jgi:hypothetical protein
MMPSAKMDALLNAPPRKLFKYPNIPLEFLLGSNKFGSIPGSTIKEPSLKMIKYPMVFRILTLRSSMEKMFFMV